MRRRCENPTCQIISRVYSGYRDLPWYYYREHSEQSRSFFFLYHIESSRSRSALDLSLFLSLCFCLSLSVDPMRELVLISARRTCGPFPILNGETVPFVVVSIQNVPRNIRDSQTYRYSSCTCPTAYLPTFIDEITCSIFPLLHTHFFSVWISQFAEVRNTPRIDPYR